MDTDRRSYLMICMLLMCLLMILPGCDENAGEEPVPDDPVVATPEVINPPSPPAGNPDDQAPEAEQPSPTPPTEEPSDEIPTATTDGSLVFPKALAEVPAFAELMDRVEDHLSIEASIAVDGDPIYDLGEDQRNQLLTLLLADFDRIREEASAENLPFSYSGDFVELFLEATPDDRPVEDPLESPWIEGAYMNSLLYQMVRGVAYGDLFFIVNLEDRQGSVTDSRSYVPSEMYH